MNTPVGVAQQCDLAPPVLVAVNVDLDATRHIQASRRNPLAMVLDYHTRARACTHVSVSVPVSRLRYSPALPQSVSVWPWFVLAPFLSSSLGLLPITVYPRPHPLSLCAPCVCHSMPTNKRANLLPDGVEEGVPRHRVFFVRKLD